MILGAAKAGTTSLYQLLSRHPEVFVSNPKEPPFFQTEYERGLEYYWRTYYRGYAGQRHAGEAAHRNLRLPYVTRRIADSVPDAKFFVLCRNPVDRAFSAYWYNFTRGLEPRTFEEALEENFELLETGPHFEDEREAPLFAEALAQARRMGRIAYAAYVESGYYARHIERFAESLGRDRIKILFFEDLARDPGATAVEALEFLGLDPAPPGDLTAYNPSLPPVLARSFRRLSAMPVVRSLPPSWRARVRRSLGSTFKTEKPKIDASTRRTLEEHFRPHDEHLARLTGRNLDHWHGSGRESRPTSIP